MPDIVTAEPIAKGWSKDEKYCVTDKNGTRYFCRVASVERQERRRGAYERMCRAWELGLPMPRPVACGIWDGRTYTLESWIEGTDAETCIPTHSKHSQYAYGQDAGRILAKLHTIPAPPEQADWETRFSRKMDGKIRTYQECPLKYKNGEVFLDYIRQNRHLLHGRPQTYQHGDYHIGNMLVDGLGVLYIIDFDRDDYGDPWEEFNRIVWCAQTSPHFASGMVDGYFGGTPPEKFWRLLALYISSNTLSSLYWAIPFGQMEIDIMQNQAAEICAWYDNMKRIVPSWYSGGAGQFENGGTQNVSV